MQERKLDKMFNPETIALIGASEKDGSVGLTLMKNLIDRKDSKLFPVNPNREKVLDIEAYPSVLKIEDPIDLGIIATPASTVPSIVEECGEKGVPALIIISAGFREVGPEGEKLEEELEKVREKYGIRILGPNCLGIIRPSVNLDRKSVV